MRIDAARKILESHLRANEPIMLWGPPGCGKTDLVNSVVLEMFGRPPIEFIASLRDTVDLRGIPDFDRVNGTTRWLPPQELPRADRDGAEGAFYLDEINAGTSPAMQAACYGIVLNGKAGEYQFPPGWRRVAAGNRQGDQSVANRLSFALANRMGHVEIEPDANVWLLWAAANGVEAMIRAFIAWRPALIYRSPADDARAAPTPRSWTRAARIILADPSSDPVDIVTANVGEHVATEFRGFVRSYAELAGLLPEITADPDNARLPSDSNPSVSWAIACRLADMVTLGNFGHFARYLARLRAEFEILAVTAAVSRLPALKAHGAVNEFNRRHQHVTL